MYTTKKWQLLVWLLLFGLMAGCSSGPPPVEYTIEFTEFSFTPDAIELQVGQEVTLHLVNKGALSHEFMVGRDAVKNADGQFAKFEHDFFHDVEPVVLMEGDGHSHDEEAEENHDEMAEEHHGDEADSHDHEMADHGFMVTLPGNDDHSSATITFTVTEHMVGEWEMGCFLDGGSHYAAGMTGTIVVVP